MEPSVLVFEDSRSILQEALVQDTPGARSQVFYIGDVRLEEALVLSVDFNVMDGRDFATLPTRRGL